MTDNRLIVALDVPGMEQVENVVSTLGDSVGYYKVGMELFYSAGSQVIHYLRQQDKQVFLDLKLHDIPNTVAHGLASLTRLGANMLNVHASGGPTMMRQAVQSVRETAENLGIERPKLIAVTILTSMSEREWQSMRYPMAIGKQVLQLAQMAQESGMDGVVASPQEAARIRSACGENFMIVTPGVRPQGSDLNDQNRIATPKSALAQGATHLVVGRPILQAANPKQAAAAIINEMREQA